MRILLWLVCAIVGAFSAMFLTGLLGYLLCLLIVRITGDQSRMQFMWIFYATGFIAMPVAFVVILIVGARMERRREQDQRESRGFPLGNPPISRKETD